jgi:hypothetical protein
MLYFKEDIVLRENGIYILYFFGNEFIYFDFKQIVISTTQIPIYRKLYLNSHIGKKKGVNIFCSEQEIGLLFS